VIEYKGFCFEKLISLEIFRDDLPKKNAFIHSILYTSKNKKECIKKCIKNIADMEER
jgi:hypothetical protein